MGILGISFLDLFEKVRSWIPFWGGRNLFGVTKEFGISYNCYRLCCVCGVHLTEFSLQYHCENCRRVMCGKCVHGAGAYVVASDGLGRIVHIKFCKFCFQAGNEQINASASCRLSLERILSCFSSENFNDIDYSKPFQTDHLARFLEIQRRDTSSQADVSSSVASSTCHPSPVSFHCSSSRIDEESIGDSGMHFFSSPSQYCQDISDIDSSSVSGRHEFYSFSSVGSSPWSRIGSSPNRAGYSVQQEQFESPTAQNGASLGQEATAISIRPQTESSEGPENIDDSSDDLLRFQDQCGTVQRPLDFESNGLIWFPPPPADNEYDEAESRFFEYEDKDDSIIGTLGTNFSSSSFNKDAYPFKEKPNEKHKGLLQAVIHEHFRALVSQLLLDEGIRVRKDSGDDWLDIITSIAWQAANFVKPDTRKGGSMGPGNCVKVKCIVSGNPSESTLIKGVACTKNIKNKRMTSLYRNPRSLLLGGALEFQKVPNQLASLDTLLQQEMDHLKMIVSKIEAHHPNVLLVEKSVSSYAQEYLLAKEISLVLNVKRPLLERIARCTGALIVPSIDNLSSARLGHCEIFRLQRVSEECPVGDHPNKKQAKTLMFFERCLRRLGCMILLNGKCREELKKVKHVGQYSVFAAYHLSLETSFLADEGATLPRISPNPPISIPERLSTNDAASITPCSTTLTVCQVKADEPQYADACVMMSSSFHQASDVPPQSEKILEELKLYGEHSSPSISPSSIDKLVPHVALQSHQQRSKVSGGSSLLPSDVRSQLQHELFENSTQEEIDSLRNHRHHGKVRKWTKTDMIDGNEVSNENFSSPENHQSLLVSLSSHCIVKRTVFERSKLLRIKFYGSFDKPLGRYIRDVLFDQTSCCRYCKEPAKAHIQCYTHRQGSLTINVRRLSSLKLPGERDGKIWMWHRCLKCAHIDGVPPATRRVVMSDSAWGLSFGKFLELSFSNHTTANRVASCGHSLQRDCLRYFGYGSMVAFFHYYPIEILSVFCHLLCLNSLG